MIGGVGVTGTVPCGTEKPSNGPVIGLFAQSSSARPGKREVANHVGRMGLELKKLKAQKDVPRKTFNRVTVQQHRITLRSRQGHDGSQLSFDTAEVFL